MSIPTFIQGNPPDGSNLGNTRVPIRNNLDGTFLTLGVDHINNNGVSSTKPSIAGTPGYHNVIRFQDQGVFPNNPVGITGVTQMYTNTDTNGEQQLYLKDGFKHVFQISTMLPNPLYATFASPGTNNCWTFLPGGQIQIRGSTGIITGHTSKTVNFGASGFPAFADTNYNIQITPWIDNPFPGDTINLYVNAKTTGISPPLTTSSFTVINGGTSAGIYYILTGYPA